jgi:hypothetical protein
VRCGSEADGDDLADLCEPATEGEDQAPVAARRCICAVRLEGLRCEPPPDLPSPPQSKACAEQEAVDAESMITGLVGGVRFTDVAAAFVIESPDSDATTVIYLFSKSVRCVDLSFSRWDRAIATGTLVLDLKLLGKDRGSFLSVTTPTISRREAAAEWVRTSAKGVEKEARSSGGWITSTPRERQLSTSRMQILVTNSVV